VTITNENTGCTAISNPIEVIVHPAPNDVQIASDLPSPICNGTAVNLAVQNPDPNLIYVWNTGEQNTQIQAQTAGEYFVRVLNNFGCEGISNSIEIENAPNINAVPDGCHFSCLPETICLPEMPNVIHFQWFKDGQAISAPEGTVKDLEIEEGGIYTLEMTDAFGCIAISDPISMTLDVGFGNILGEIYFDVNENGIIDAMDTLVSDIDVFLVQNGIYLDTLTSNENGFFGFVNQVSENDYLVILNTNNLPPNWSAYQVFQDVNLTGCDAENVINFLLFEACQPSESDLVLEICPNTTIEYEGMTLAIGDEQNFLLQSTEGCDSTVSVSVIGLPEHAQNIEFSTCEGNEINYNGTLIPAGETMNFTFPNQFGCDSLVIVSVVILPINEEDIFLQTCPNSTVAFAGFQFTPGDSEVFILQNQYGCDSILNLTVEAFNSSHDTLNVEICEDAIFEFNGEAMIINSQQDFIFQNSEGCDSIITVFVEQFPEISYQLIPSESCPNEDSGSIEVVDIQGDTTDLVFMFIRNNIIYNGHFFDNLPADEYNVFATDRNGCFYQETTEIPSIPNLEITLENAQIDCNETGIELIPFTENYDENDLLWQWQDGSDLTTFFAEIAGIYTVNATSECQTIEKNVTVEYALDTRKEFIFLPNVFSPNNDQINDEFQVYFEGNVEVLDFTWRIFDRWGNLLFETNNPTDTWDGQFKGKFLNSAVFIWHLEADIRTCGQLKRVEKKGDVLIMK